MIPFKIRHTSLTALVFDKDKGTTVYVELETMRRWKRAIDAWTVVQGEMAALERAAQPSPEPLEDPQPITQWQGIAPVTQEVDLVAQNTSVQITPRQVPNANGELIAFDSRSYMGSGISNGVATHEQPKQLSIPTATGRPATDLRQPAKRKRGRPRSKAQSPTPQQEADQAQVAVT